MQRQEQTDREDILEQYDVRSLVKAIEEDHEDLRRFIKVLKSDHESLSSKKSAYEQFTELLSSHAKSEEQAMYVYCKDVDELAQNAYEGYTEHAIAEHLMQEIERLKEREDWLAHVKVLAELVEHHIKEEEGEFLPEIRKELDKDEQLDILEKFLMLRQKTQEHVGKKNGGVLSH